MDGPLFASTRTPTARVDEVIAFDPSEPLGTVLHPLGFREDAPRSYLLGVACACGARPLVLASAYESETELACPRCGTSLR